MCHMDDGMCQVDDGMDPRRHAHQPQAGRPLDRLDTEDIVFLT